MNTDMNKVETMICRTQADIFVYMSKLGYNMEIFSTAYMNSEWTRRAMDTKYSRFQIREPEECLDFILPEIENLLTKYSDDIIFNPDIAEWIGFTYRQLYIETQIPSEKLIKIISFRAMCAYYPGLHTVDEEMATDIICENYELSKKPRK